MDSNHSLRCMQILDFEALEKQPQTELALDILRLHSRNDTSLVKSCGPSAVRSSTSDIGRTSECVQREPKINSEEWETTPGVGRLLLLDPSHAGGLLLSHWNAWNRKLVWPIWNTWVGSRGEEGLPSCTGGSVYPGHCRFLLACFPVSFWAHTLHRHPGRLTCKEVWM